MTVSSDTPPASPPPGAPPPSAPAGNKQAPARLWPELKAAAAEFYAWLMRPRVRLTLAGALLLLVGGLIATNTVWTLPLVIVGALMVAVAWIGHRLEGRFAVEWGEAGTQLAFNATIKAPHPAADAPALGSAAPARSTPALPTQLARTADDVIDGEAHTVDINVSELKALIAAAEAADATKAAKPAARDRDAGEAPAPRPAAGPAPAAAPAPEADVRDIRIRRLADDSAPAPRPAG